MKMVWLVNRIKMMVKLILLLAMFNQRYDNLGADVVIWVEEEE